MNTENIIVMIFSIILLSLSIVMIVNQFRLNYLSNKTFSEFRNEKMQQLQKSMTALLDIGKSVFKPKDFLCHINVGDNPCELNSEINIQESFITSAQLFWQER